MSRGGNDYYYHTDDLFNVVALTDKDGNVVETYDYDDYGNPTTTSSVGNPYLFNGRRYDEETSYYYYRTRYLDPQAGRFTTRDIIGIWGDPNNLGSGYTYVGNNPWTLVDPWGLEQVGIFAVGDNAEEREQFAKGCMETSTKFGEIVIKLTPPVAAYLAVETIFDPNSSGWSKVLSVPDLIPGGKVGTTVVTTTERVACCIGRNLVDAWGFFRKVDNVDDIIDAGKKASNSGRKALALDNYRGRYNAWKHAQGKPRLPDDYDAHHKIPLRYQDHPEFQEFDFHDPSNIEGVKGSRADVNIHKDITNEWESFHSSNPNASRADIESFADDIYDKYSSHWFY